MINRTYACSPVPPWFGQIILAVPVAAIVVQDRKSTALGGGCDPTRRCVPDSSRNPSESHVFIA
ncbi:hypothetical protein H6F89_14360 [Cyanobacteria bacterium FACHB-63]|nr:hypothetical protein [Cyanobacteria bacterium FACHB-63]